MDLAIPKKSLFKLSEVASITGVKPYVLRFWETEFDCISPITSSSGQRLYEPKDVEAVAIIKKLLFEEKMNIEQAKLELHRINNGESELENTSFAPDLPKVIRNIDEGELNKLLQARDVLSSLVDRTKEIQDQNRWI